MDKNTYIGHEIQIMSNLFKRHMEADIREKGFEGMTMTNRFIIRFLMDHKDETVFQKDLEQHLQIGKASIAGTLKIMEEKGYIIRHSVPQDARLKRIILTEKAYAFAKKMEQGRERAEEKVREGISEEELDEFIRIIRKMQANIGGREKELCLKQSVSS